jgi:hypothetical protein
MIEQNNCGNKLAFATAFEHVKGHFNAGNYSMDITDAELERLFNDDAVIDIEPPQPVSVMEPEKDNSIMAQVKRKLEAKALIDARKQLERKTLLEEEKAFKARQLKMKIPLEVKPSEVSFVAIFSDMETTEQLLKCLGNIRAEAALGNFDENAAQRFRQISETLTEQGISPTARNCRGFKPAAYTDNKAASRFTNSLQACDLQWVWHTNNGHEVDCGTRDGLYEGIFDGDVFDWEQAEAIAVGEFTDYSEKIKNLTKNEKIKGLMLPYYIQEQLSVLYSDAVRKKIERKAKAKRVETAKIKGIQVESMDVRHKLAAHIKSNKPDNRIVIDIDECVSIWVAIKQCGGNKSSHVRNMEAYEKLTGKPIDKSVLRRRIGFMESASIL